MCLQMPKDLISNFQGDGHWWSQRPCTICSQAIQATWSIAPLQVQSFSASGGALALAIAELFSLTLLSCFASCYSSNGLIAVTSLHSV